MMYLLDTDTLSRLHAGDARVETHKDRFDRAMIATTVITRIEILRGRFDFLLKAADGTQLHVAREWLDRSEALLADFVVVPRTDTAVGEFEKLRANKKLKKIGRADLLISAIVLSLEATLITRNVKHFRQVPDLRIENWLD